MEAWLLFAGTVVTAASSVIAVIITNNKAHRDILQQIEVTNAVRDEKIEELTREVRLHNNFAQRMPVVEGDMKVIREQIKVVNHRIEDLEGK
uniref:Uncharacterized protein n=1 Tax=Siphoviridae sp. ctg6c78 TaxID=2825603 RepID=A0A8S5URK9_9CAUD|nr:MAG TPA: hypothetical protein [Caudoviricetes sp.]DAF97067.1 MAG TPA: hypothetical protein [Siphoviridae sp. ctg6c78]